jgi:hypothetical protein
MPTIIYDNVSDHQLLQQLTSTYLLPDLTNLLTHPGRPGPTSYGSQPSKHIDTHLYIFPGSVKHMHPEFDSAISVLLKTDPFAYVCIVLSLLASVDGRLVD